MSLQHHLPTPSTHRVSNFLKSHTTFRNNFRKAKEHTSVGAVSKKSVTKDSEFKANLYNKARALVSKRKAKKKKKGKGVFSNVIQFKNQLHNRYSCLDPSFRTEREYAEKQAVKTVSQTNLEM